MIEHIDTIITFVEYVELLILAFICLGCLYVQRATNEPPKIDIKKYDEKL